MILALSLFGCTKEDQLGKYLAKSINGDGDIQSRQCQTSSFQSLSSSDDESPRVLASDVNAGKKIHLVENKDLDSSGFAGLTSASEIEIPADKTVVIDFNPDCLKERSSVLAQSLNVDLSEIEKGGVASVSHKLDQSVSYLEFADLVESDDCVKSVSEKYHARLRLASNDPRFAQQLFHPNIKSVQAWDTFFHVDTGIEEEIIIAIIDSGVDLSHPDLRNHLWVNPGESGGGKETDGIDNDGNGFIDDVNGMRYSPNFAGNATERSGNPNPIPWSFPDPNHPCREDGGDPSGQEDHGTHVAGLSGAELNNAIGVAGVMGKKVKIMALNVFGPFCGTGNDHIATAVRYAHQKGAHVMNLSLGGPANPLPQNLRSEFSAAVSAGTFVVVAAGNDGEELTDTYLDSPASFGVEFEGMVAVGATNSTTNARCGFSNYSRTYVEIGAPGCNGLLSTIIGNDYAAFQGTSMASPVTAGAAGLIYGLINSRKTSGEATMAEIEDILTTKARVQAGLNVQQGFEGGHVVDLVNYANEINVRYPAGGATPPPPPPPVEECP